MIVRVFCCLSVVMLMACGDSGGDTSNDGASQNDTGASTDVGDEDTAVVAADTAQEEDTGSIEPDVPVEVDPCDARLEWSSGPDFPAPRDHHGSLVYTRADGQAVLQVQGGTNYSGIFDDVWEAEIQSYGSLDAWQEGRTLPTIRAGHAVAQKDNTIFLVGGRDTRGFLATTLRPTFDEAGSIAGWEEQTPLPEARFHASAATDGKHVWLTGGLGEGNEAQNEVYVTPIGEDGALGEWTRLDRLFASRSHHASFIRNGRLYLAYGFKGNPIGNQTEEHPNIIAADILEDGELGRWTTVFNDDLAISTLSVSVVDDCAFMVAGLRRESENAYSYNDQLWRLDFDQDGAPTRKAVEATLEVGRSHLHQAPFFEGHLYVISGSQDLQDPTPKVEIGRFVAP